VWNKERIESVIKLDLVKEIKSRGKRGKRGRGSGALFLFTGASLWRMDRNF
jgi:hypothetical protein